MPAHDPDFPAFRRHGCPKAFERLVERHLPAVHGSARRVLGSRYDLAEDVAQAVFIRLARKGRALPEGIVIGAWLHRQTVRLALNTLRTETRRFKREQLAAEMQLSEQQNQAESPSWNEVMPHIDRAILELSEKDRAALALRFGERLKVREIGERLGLTTAAAEKRIARALTKLRGRLLRYGIASSSLVLGGWLAKHATEEVPSTLAATITHQASAAIDSSSSLVTHLITMTSTQSLVTGLAAGLLLGSGLVAWSSASSDSPATAPSLSKAAAHLLPARTRTASSRWSVLKPAATAEEVFEQVQQLLTEPDNEISRLRIRALLEALRADQFEPLLKLVNQQLNKYWERNRILPELARAWGAIDPHMAIEVLIKSPGTSGWTTPKLASEAFTAWYRQSPEVAQDWLVENQGNVGLAPAIPRIITTIAEDLSANSGSSEVVAWASKLEGKEYQLAALTALWDSFIKDHYDVDHATELPRLFELFAGVEDRELSGLAIRHLTGEWAKWRDGEFEAWIEQQEPGPLAYQAALASVRLEQIAKRNGFSHTVGTLRPFGARERIANAERALRLAGDRETSAVIIEIVQEMQVVPKGVVDWALPKLPAAGAARDEAILSAAEAAADSWHRSSNSYPPPRIALDWAVHHSDPVVRDQLIERFYRQWLEKPEWKEAQHFPETSDWSDELKGVLRRVRENP